MTSTGPARIALFMPFLGGRGAQRVLLNLANGFAAAGRNVDLVLAERRGELLEFVDPAVRIVDLGSPGGVLRSLPAYRRYLRREQRDVLLTAMDYVNALSVAVRAFSSRRTRLFLTCHNSILTSVRHSPWARDRLLPLAMRLTYRHADGVITVSAGVADAIAKVTGLPRDRITVIHNPVVVPGFAEAAAAPLDHPWFQPGQPPVVLGAGSLTAQKDFHTLLRAFALVARRRSARLVILGEGEERPSLERLATELGITESFQLPGWVRNPLACMSRAGVFVLSSRWEGFGLVLAEALACGTPVVSTDCQSGPAEILQGGRFGKLVPTEDPDAMADAIMAQLDAPPDPSESRRRGNDFALNRIVDRYLDTFGRNTRPAPTINGRHPGTSGPSGSATAMSPTPTFPYLTAPADNPHACCVIQLGARLHYMLPEALERSGLLGKLYTDFCVFPGEGKLLDRLPIGRLPTPARRLLGRRLPASIPTGRVRRHPLVSFRDRWLLSRHAGAEKDVHFWYEHQLGANHLARRLIERNFDGCDSLYVQSCNARDAIAEAKRRGLPVIYESVGHPNDQFIESDEYERFGLPPRYPLDLRQRVHAWFREELAMADVVLGASAYSVRGLIEFGVPDHKVRLLPYSLPERFFDAAPRPQLGRVLFVGSVGFRKGLPYLAEAARLLKQSHPTIEVRVAGPFELDIRDRSEFQGPTYLGQVPRGQVKQEFLSADLFVFPTVSDAFGIVLMEALQSGLPIVATPNCADALEDGRNGIRVPVRDGKALADAIARIVSDRPLRAAMSAESLALASRFTPQAYADGLATVFAGLPGAGRAVQPATPADTPTPR